MSKLPLEMCGSDLYLQANKWPSEQPLPKQEQPSKEGIELFASAIGVYPRMVELKPDGQLGLKAKFD